MKAVGNFRRTVCDEVTRARLVSTGSVRALGGRTRCRATDYLSVSVGLGNVVFAAKAWEILADQFVGSESQREARKRMNHFVVEGLAIALVLTQSALAQAQEAEPEATGEPPAAGEAAPAETATPAPPAAAAPGGDTSSAVADGARFRFGVAAGAGFFTAASEVGTAKVSCTYYGADLRLGAQINNLIGVYAQPTLGYYSVDGAGGLAAGGLLGVAVVADATFIDRLFVGAGIGYTVYNSPAGVTPILRFGGYPLMGRSEQKARRKGLMVGVDLRFTSLEGLKTIVMPTFNLGYEAF